MMLPSNEDKAWIQFLTASENSILRDVGVTLAALAGISLGDETCFVPLEQKNPEEWESALLLARCLELSTSDDLVEVSRVLFEWFSVTFRADLHS